MSKKKFCVGIMLNIYKYTGLFIVLTAIVTEAIGDIGTLSFYISMFCGIIMAAISDFAGRNLDCF